MQTWVKSKSIQIYEVDGSNIFLQLWRQKCLKVDEITFHPSTFFSKREQFLIREGTYGLFGFLYFFISIHIAFRFSNDGFD